MWKFENFSYSYLREINFWPKLPILTTVSARLLKERFKTTKLISRKILEAEKILNFHTVEKSFLFDDTFFRQIILTKIQFISMYKSYFVKCRLKNQSKLPSFHFTAFLLFCLFCLDLSILASDPSESKLGTVSSFSSDSEFFLLVLDLGPGLAFLLEL